MAGPQAAGYNPGVTPAESARQAGVVGAGGGGFPTAVKLAARAQLVIGNGAECEPLLHKDAAILAHRARRVVDGVRLAMESVGAPEGVIAVKAKNREAAAAVETACLGTPVRLAPLGDYYPAGDEYDLVHEITGRLIPPAGLPLDVGCVVCNVETLANLADAHDGAPVTRKTLTVAGAVRHPVTLTVPVGTPFQDCLDAAGGPTVDDPVFFPGGLMMGSMTEDGQSPVLKTTAGIIVLPRDHPVARRKLTPPRAQAGIGRSACDQCRYCTEYCPRYLLGYAVEPHQVMRGLAHTATGADRWNEWAALCCSCGLCTLFACPEGLFPKEACDDARSALRAAGHRWKGPAPARPHPLRDGRRVPIRALLRRLHVEAYDHPAHWAPIEVHPARAVLPLKQHAGAPAQPLLSAGMHVTLGQPIAQPAAGALGAALHASIPGRIATVDARALVIEHAAPGHPAPSRP